MTSSSPSHPIPVQGVEKKIYNLKRLDGAGGTHVYGPLLGLFSSELIYVGRESVRRNS